MKNLKVAHPGEIQKIHAHMEAGNQVLVKTEGGRGTVLKKSHKDYIRADGNGYRIGWPGKRSTYVFAYHVFLVDEGFKY
jgi:hypothetical protein